MKDNDISSGDSDGLASKSLAKPVEVTYDLPLFIGDEATWSRNLPAGYYANPPIPDGWDQVYFAQQGASGPIKIGYSNRSLSRLAALQTAHAEELRLIGAIAGDRTVEKEWHTRFAKFRLRGEWFSAAPELLETIHKALWRHPHNTKAKTDDT